MSHPAAAAIAIVDAATSLGLEIEGRHVRCFNASAHQGGDDARPSLTFFVESNRFQCFSCGVKGDLIDLIRAVKQCGFKAAVEWIEGLSGSQPFSCKTVAPPASRNTRTSNKQARAIDAALFRNTYEVGPKMQGGKYLRQRQLDLSLVGEYGATQILDPDEVWSILNDEFGLDRLRSAGLVSQKGNFLFARHRLLFFYFDHGWPVYVQVRNIDDASQPKELSLAGLHSPVPYNADLLRTPQKRVYICEGCIDTLSAIQMGLPAVGVPGVLGFRQEWFDLFRNVGHVVLLFDGDEAGRRQAAELRAQFRLHKIKADAYQPEGVKDMNDLLLQKSGGFLP